MPATREKAERLLALEHASECGGVVHSWLYTKAANGRNRTRNGSSSLD